MKSNYIYLCLLLTFSLAGFANSQNLNLDSAEAESETIGGNNVIDVLWPSTQCGGRWLGDSKGSIQYKLSANLVLNERCVWTIGADGATGFSVSIFSLGFPAPTVDHQLLITSFEGDKAPRTVIPDRLGMYDFNGSHALIITFSTGNGSDVINQNGFHLEYTTYHDHDTSVFRQYTKFKVADYERDLLDGFTLVNGDQLIFFLIFSWENNLFNSHQTMKLFTGREGAWNAFARLEAYIFRPDSSSYQLVNVLDVKKQPTAMIESNDVLLFAYRRNQTADESERFRLANFHSFNCPGGRDNLNDPEQEERNVSPEKRFLSSRLI